MKRFATFAAAAAVVVLLGTSCPAQETPQPAPNANVPVGSSRSKPASGEMTVTIMSDNTMFPTTAFVRPGTTVTWKNEDSDQHQLRSNPHPSHTDLPGFGPPNPQKPGETYSYKFEETTRFNYHDHLNPAFGGAVVVLE